jgi:hypothetical protein
MAGCAGFDPRLAKLLDDHPRGGLRLAARPAAGRWRASDATGRVNATSRQEQHIDHQRDEGE